MERKALYEYNRSMISPALCAAACCSLCVVCAWCFQWADFFLLLAAVIVCCFFTVVGIK